jgi:hypothetical protein
MRHNYVADLSALLASYRKRDTAGINGNTFVNEKTGQTLFGGCVALTIKAAG